MLEIVIIGIIVLIITSNQNRKIDKLEYKLNDLIKKIEVKSTVQPSTVSNVVSGISVAENNLATPPVVNTYVQPVETTKDQYHEESSGRILGKIGIGALVLGVASFLKYAFDNNWIGPAGRILVGVLIGFILISLGQYFRKKYITFSEVMFGGGIAILYLSFFAAHNFYNLIDPLNTGILMFLTTVLTFIFSFVNKDNKLAILAVIGGFVTPYLIGNTNNNMMEIFTYLTILNIGVLGVTIFKKWPELIAIAILGTAVNFFTWFNVFYDKTLLASTLFFLIITFSIFLIASIYRIVISKVKSGEVDYFVLLVNAFGFFAIFYNIMKPDYESILGFCTLLIGILYVIIAYVANKQNHEDLALNIFLPGLAVAFISIAVPIQFSGAYIAIAWFIEACVLYLIALSISNRGFQVMGVAVYVLGLLNFFYYNAFNTDGVNFVPFANKAFTILMFAIVAAYAITYIYYKYGSTSVDIQKRGIVAFLIVANILTLYALTTQVIYNYDAKEMAITNNYTELRNNLLKNSDGEYNSSNTNEFQNYSMQLSAEQTTNKNESNTTVSILWAIYAAILTVVGFGKRSSALRIFGLTLFILTAVKVLIDIWSLGQVYRIISLIGFGVIALAGSFVYSKYKDRLKIV